MPATASELPIDNSASADEMVAEIFGDSIQIVAGTADYTGDNRASGIYSDGDTVAPDVTPGDTGVILTTGRTTAFTNGSGDPNTSGSTTTNSSGQNNNADFNAAAGTNTYDAAYIEVDFIPDGDVMTMQFVFASEEYPEYVDSIYQDLVAVWINGELVELDIGDGDTDPGNLNSGTNQNLFISNVNDDYNTEMDGFTVTMTLTIPVDDGEINSIKIGIADVGDSSYDSALLIAGGSVQSSLVAVGDSDTMYPAGTVTIDVLSNDQATGTLTITHINNIPVIADDTVELNTGQFVTLNSNGTITVIGNGDPENFNFTYTATDGTNTDTAYVEIEAVPCFVAGTMIRTPNGEQPVETLCIGDLVQTKDNGDKPVRWIGGRKCPPGHMAPICIRNGTLDRMTTLRFTPTPHSGAGRAGGAPVRQRGGSRRGQGSGRRSITKVQGGDVTYVHLMFDMHQVVYSQGLETESFLPGPQTTNLFEQQVVDEICRLFPELDPNTGNGYSPAARRTLRHFEAQLLTNNAKVA